MLPAKAPARLGTFELKDGVVTFTADPVGPRHDRGQPVTTTAFDLRAGDEGAIRSGDLVMFPIQRGDKIGIRMRDLQSAMRQRFTGVRTYPGAARIPHRRALRRVPAAEEGAGAQRAGPAPGDDEPRLRHLHAERPRAAARAGVRDRRAKELFFIFSDATSRDATYAAGRFLYAALPKDGTVILDFNKAINPPCAFTDFATCPLPIKENRLPVRIEAGELAYHGPTR